METTLDVLKRIEAQLNEEMTTTEQQYYKEETDYMHTALVWERVGLKIALICIHEEMDKITGLGQ